VLAICGIFGPHRGTVLRVTLAYVFVWLCFRVIGKRELTGMSPFELVTLLFIPQMFSRALMGQDYSMTNAIIGASTLVSLVFLTSVGTYWSRRLSRIVVPAPTVLASQGQFITAHLDQERITPNDVFDAMHRSGLSRLEQVEWAILQPDGRIAIIPAHDGWHSDGP